MGLLSYQSCYTVLGNLSIGIPFINMLSISLTYLQTHPLTLLSRYGISSMVTGEPVSFLTRLLVMLYPCEMQWLNSCGSDTSVIFQSLVFYSHEFILCRDHLDLLERNNQLILELKHLDSTPAQRYIHTLYIHVYTSITP